MSTEVLVSGYIRGVESLLKDQIIPDPVYDLCYLYYPNHSQYLRFKSVQCTPYWFVGYGFLGIVFIVLGVVAGNIIGAGPLAAGGLCIVIALVKSRYLM